MNQLLSVKRESTRIWTAPCDVEAQAPVLSTAPSISEKELDLRTCGLLSAVYHIEVNRGSTRGLDHMVK
ncbi:hypothetical protein RSOLAG1IB_02792 [Rhizoctonia solani AG-1 IB]|jgi:hypothetical protein|uniref:Uncharacterized protein n=1 Tax=Thanatephorus cucumeris (strain AG1-IB / isolate 7/3/14) TaxID=1108050 RepID=A0A0B7FPF6_THACB|nr:hypothetical protein RSOLAG1IB_02792 [Rhizoctonia solani AG-1 IB]